MLRDGLKAREVWTQCEAIALCCLIERFAPQFGCHVALTGGLLYKEGPRKDADILFYRIRQVDKIDVTGLFNALAPLGFERLTDGEPWCIKAKYKGSPVDCFFPDAETGTYDHDDSEQVKRG